MDDGDGVCSLARLVGIMFVHCFRRLDNVGKGAVWRLHISGIDLPAKTKGVALRITNGLLIEEEAGGGGGR